MDLLLDVWPIDRVSVVWSLISEIILGVISTEQEVANFRKALKEAGMDEAIRVLQKIYDDADGRSSMKAGSSLNSKDDSDAGESSSDASSAASTIDGTLDENVEPDNVGIDNGGVDNGGIDNVPADNAGADAAGAAAVSSVLSDFLWTRPSLIFLLPETPPTVRPFFLFSLSSLIKCLPPR